MNLKNNPELALLFSMDEVNLSHIVHHYNGCICITFECIDRYHVYCIVFIVYEKQF